MRALALAAVLAVPAAAHADSFLEVTGGISIPVGDDNWTKTAESSPKIGARVGAVGDDNGIGGMLQADWTPVNLDSGGGGSFGFGTVDVAAHRFRVLADLAFHKRVAPKLLVNLRAGAGIDVAHAAASGNVLGVNFSSSDTNVGFGFEVGGGLYVDLGSAQIGGELALPIGHHSKQGSTPPSDGNYTFDYTSYDVDILLGVRFVSR
jgi:hypothetical protein